ncbi:hypothetical protein B9T31_05110 [Acinetobacter sp. ANC 4558]|uniref:LysR substrate-binding domain-containing protein n=1 Tax=Acinetobacter sp. ANC 4558 TaxID=1977876 RepID=UPI000A351D1C|nr:LysR substrate-binding domain-containing protein [Acinetobacter sp. ANC 4558]OTG86993.1 hypothetical protein B9T31_05110 [Acinetobacter sp. ANC 4558]
MRQKAEMIPTIKAEIIYKVFKSALLQIDSILVEEKFDLSNSKGVFKIAVSDLGASFFIPFIYKKIKDIAPNLNLEVIQLDYKDIKNSILKGEVDLCIGNKIEELKDFFYELILKDEYIGVISSSQDFQENKIKDYSFISISSHAGHKQLEDWIKTNKLKNKLKLPNFNAIEYMIENENHIAIVPYTLTKKLNSEVKIIDLPLEFPKIEIVVYRSNNSLHPHLCKWISTEINKHNWYY